MNDLTIFWLSPGTWAAMLMVIIVQSLPISSGQSLRHSLSSRYFTSNPTILSESTLTTPDGPNWSFGSGQRRLSITFLPFCTPIVY
jgi:hypothetical protein